MRVVILGAGDHAKIACDILLEMDHDVVGYLADDGLRHGAELLGFPVLGPIESWNEHGAHALALGAGNNRLRKEFMERCAGAEWITLIHPSANHSRFATIGEGAMLAAGSWVGPLAQIGRGAIVNTKASVDHDCAIGDFAHVAVGATLAGTVRVGEGAMLGAGCSVIPGLAIGNWAIVGAGAAVIRDVLPGTTVVGVPARVLR